jgi:hypothetical protein
VHRHFGRNGASRAGGWDHIEPVTRRYVEMTLEGFMAPGQFGLSIGGRATNHFVRIPGRCALQSPPLRSAF